MSYWYAGFVNGLRNKVKNIFQGQLPGNFINLKHGQLVKQAVTLILGKLRSGIFLGTLSIHLWYLGTFSFFLKKERRRGSNYVITGCNIQWHD